jgi:hypothetical protein
VVSASGEALFARAVPSDEAEIGRMIDDASGDGRDFEHLLGGMGAREWPAEVVPRWYRPRETQAVFRDFARVLGFFANYSGIGHRCGVVQTSLPRNFT